MEENKKPENEQKPKKKKFNSTLLWQILGIVVFVACFAFTIYEVVVFDEVDMWAPILCFTIAIMLAFSYFKNAFIFGKKAFRNRLFLFIGACFAMSIPNLIGNIVMFATGRYKNDAAAVELIAKNGIKASTACTVTVLAEILTFALLCALVALCIEMLIRDSIKKQKV